MGITLVMAGYGILPGQPVTQAIQSLVSRTEPQIAGTIFVYGIYTRTERYTPLYNSPVGRQITETLIPFPYLYIAEPGRHPHTTAGIGIETSYLIFHIPGVRIYLSVAELQLVQTDIATHPYILLVILKNRPYRRRQKPSGVIRLQCQCIHIDTVQSAFSQKEE